MIPAELKAIPNWLCWKTIGEDNRKMPVIAATGFAAASDNPETWCDFDMADACKDAYNGLGFVFTPEIGMVGIDLDDCLINGELQPWAKPILAMLPTYAEISPSGNGIKLWLKGDISKASKKKWYPLGKPVKGEKHKAAVEIYSTGRFFTVTGNHWTGSPIEVVDCQPALDFLIAAHYMSPVFVRSQAWQRNGSDDAFRRAEAYVARIPGAESGQHGHDVTFKVACHLVRGFSLGFDDAMAIISDWNLTCLPPWEERDIERKITQAITSSTLPDGYLLSRDDQLSNPIDESGIAGILNQGNTPNLMLLNLERESMEAFPSECLAPEGTLGKIIRQNLDSAMYPMPELALAGALALMSVITGRKVQDRRELRTNGYYLGLAAAGSGKNFARQLNAKILMKLGDDMLGPSKLKSSAGLVNALVAQPSCLFQLDEISRLLHTMKNPKEAPHLYDIGSVMLEAYGEANTLWKPGAYADSKKNPVVDQPHLVVYGTAVPDEFWSSITVGNLTDGLLGRMMVFEFTGETIIVEQDLKPLCEIMLYEIQSWLDYEPAGVGNLKKLSPTPTVIQHTAEAWRRYWDHTKAIVNGKPGESHVVKGIWRRTAEKTGKLAILSACSRCPPIGGAFPTIELQDVDWAIRLSNWLTRRLLIQAGLYVAENAHQDNLNRILRMLDDWTSKEVIGQKCRWMKARDRNELITAAVLDGLILQRTIQTENRPRTEWRRAATVFL